MLIGDTDAVTNIHCVCFPNSRSTSLGKRFVHKMYRWFLKNQPLLAFVAEVNKTPIGFVTGAVGDYGRGVFASATLQILCGLIQNPRLLLSRSIFREWNTFIKWRFSNRTRSNDPSPREILTRAGVASIAVLPNYRGLGIGVALLGAFEHAAEKQNVAVLTLSVERDNAGARRLYERCDWHLASEDEAHNSAYYHKRTLAD